MVRCASTYVRGRTVWYRTRTHAAVRCVAKPLPRRANARTLQGPSFVLSSRAPNSACVFAEGCWQ